MNTIDKLNITSISIRNKCEVMGSTKDYKARLGLNLSKEMNDKLQLISNDLDANVTEIIRQSVSIILDKYGEVTDEDC